MLCKAFSVVGVFSSGSMVESDIDLVIDLDLGHGKMPCLLKCAKKD